MTISVERVFDYDTSQEQLKGIKILFPEEITKPNLLLLNQKIVSRLKKLRESEAIILRFIDEEELHGVSLEEIVDLLKAKTKVKPEIGQVLAKTMSIAFIDLNPESFKLYKKIWSMIMNKNWEKIKNFYQRGLKKQNTHLKNVIEIQIQIQKTEKNINSLPSSIINSSIIIKNKNIIIPLKFSQDSNKNMKVLRDLKAKIDIIENLSVYSPITDKFYYAKKSYWEGIIYFILNGEFEEARRFSREK
jgi:hypothetical protein